MKPRPTSTGQRSPRAAALQRCAPGLLLACALAGAPTPLLAQDQSIDLGEVLSAQASQRAPDGSEILSRALGNLYGFDASIAVSVQRRSRSSGAVSNSEFLLQRSSNQGALRVLVVSLRPADVRGTRVLQVRSPEGREETYAFLPAMGGDPMPTNYRLAEPFLGTWREVSEDESSLLAGAPADYEVLGLEPRSNGSEPTYLLTVRPLVVRGYDWAELVIARSDYAILEQRQYFMTRETPALTYSAPRDAMVRFGERVVPTRVRYTDQSDNSEIEVQIRHAPLPSDSEALFLPRTFHRIPLSELSQAAAP
jgi:hypothetical protein